jgi:tRNA-dihydrouridine synthase A
VLGLFHAQPGGRAFRQVLSQGAHLDGAGWDLIDRALEVTEQQLAASRARLQSASGAGA